MVWESCIWYQWPLFLSVWQWQHSYYDIWPIHKYAQQILFSQLCFCSTETDIEFGSKMAQHHILLCSWTQFTNQMKFPVLGTFLDSPYAKSVSLQLFYGVTWRVSICNMSGKLQWAQGSNYTRKKCYTTSHASACNGKCWVKQLQASILIQDI
jgi:hypothetical protein